MIGTNYEEIFLCYPTNYNTEAFKHLLAGIVFKVNLKNWNKIIQKASSLYCRYM